MALERSMKLKARRAAQDAQEELALDMKILEQLLEESKNEAQDVAENRKRRKEENQKYREYLAQMVKLPSINRLLLC